MTCTTVSSRHAVYVGRSAVSALCDPMDCHGLPWTAAHQAPLSTRFPRISPAFLAVSRIGRQGFFTAAPAGKPQFQAYNTVICYFYTSQKPLAYFEISFLLKGTRAARRNDGFQRRGKNYKARPALWCRKTRLCSNDDAHVQGHGSQLERAPTGQIRGSLNPEVKNTVNRL